MEIFLNTIKPSNNIHFKNSHSKRSEYNFNRNYTQDEYLSRFSATRERRANKAVPKTLKGTLIEIFAPNSTFALKRKIQRNMALIDLYGHARLEFNLYNRHKYDSIQDYLLFSALDNSSKEGTIDEKIRYYERMMDFVDKIDFVDDKKVLMEINKFFKRFEKDELVATRLPNIEYLMDMVDESLGISTIDMLDVSSQLLSD